MRKGSSRSRLGLGHVNLKVNPHMQRFLLAYPVSCMRRLPACGVILIKSEKEVYTVCGKHTSNWLCQTVKVAL